VSRNLEIKVRLDGADLTSIRDRAAALGVTSFTELRQTDTYFEVNHGRLKLREIHGEAGETCELISYRRPDDSGSRWSDYHLIPLALDTGRELKLALASACGVKVVVDKVRMVGIWHRTRIHLDAVTDLGGFVELETVASGDATDDELRTEHDHVIEMLGLSAFPVVAGSYSDLAYADRLGSANETHGKEQIA
jgi:adenylate cyclase class IV